MSEYSKIAGTHLRRAAVVYVRQSSASSARPQPGSPPTGQYALVERAVGLGWPRGAVRVDRRRSRHLRRTRQRPVRVDRVDQPGRARSGRHGARLGGVAAGPLRTATGTGCWIWLG